MRRSSDIESLADIRVIGVGGGGCNAVDRMIDQGIRGVEFIAMNTDAQALLRSQATIRIRLGESATRGLGSGGDPEIGENAAVESIDHIFEMVKGADMIFVTAGIGGGTGTGAAPIIAREARKEGALTIGVVTKPFFFEGTHRMAVALSGIENLKKEVDTLIVIPNDRILELTNRQMTLSDSFCLADDFLRQGIRGISELITVPGIINLDFADVKTIMAAGGAALIGVGEAEGKNRAQLAAERAISSNLLDLTIHGAKSILFNVSGGPDLSLQEVYEAAGIVQAMAHTDVNLIFGAVIDDNMVNKIRVTVVATGFEHYEPRQRMIEKREMNKKAPLLISKNTPVRENASIVQNVWAGLEINHDDLAIPAFLRQR